jgi:hypothetical protein
VEGTAEINVAPDQVILTLGVESKDKTTTGAKSQSDARAKKVIALALASGVVEKDIRTSALEMTPDYSEEKVPRLLGYGVSQTIAITLRDLSKYETLMTQLLEASVNRVQGVNFQIGEPAKYRSEARLEAIRAAKEKAASMAKELGQTIGKPWEVSEEGNNAFLATSYYYANSTRNRGVTQQESTGTVAPGQVTISATVRVSFQLE